MSENWREWMARRFPGKFVDFAPHHERAWSWIESLRAGVKPRSLVECWARGGGKSTTMEHGCAFVCDRLTRHYMLYVSATQEMADKHVADIMGLFDEMGIERAITKYGHSKGWRRNQLRTSRGFNIAGFGLDTGIRGIKLDGYRPDWIHLDDIDDEKDTLLTIEKKINILTSAIIGAASTDCAISFVQNAIHRESIMQRMIDGRAEFLMDRAPVVPVPALLDLEIDQRPDKSYFIVKGKPTWSGQNVEICEYQINDRGVKAFLKEAQHKVSDASDHAYFDTELIDKWLAEVRTGFHTPITNLRFLDSLACLDYPYAQGELKIWETPMQGRRYLVSADPAGGVDKDGRRDRCSCDVLDAETYCQVAHLHGYWEPDEFARLIDALGRCYNMALVAVLRLNHGHSVLNSLRNTFHYPAQYGRGFSGIYYYDPAQVFGQAKATDVKALQPGWPEDVRTKPFMLDSLEVDIRQETLVIRSEATLQECRTFIHLPGGKSGADVGAFDDCVSSLAVGSAVLKLRSALQASEDYAPVDPATSTRRRG